MATAATDRKVKVLRTVSLPVEGSSGEQRLVEPGATVTVPVAVAERFIRIGAAEKA